MSIRPLVLRVAMTLLILSFGVIFSSETHADEYELDPLLDELLDEALPQNGTQPPVAGAAGVAPDATVDSTDSAASSAASESDIYTNRTDSGYVAIPGDLSQPLKYGSNDGFEFNITRKTNSSSEVTGSLTGERVVAFANEESELVAFGIDLSTEEHAAVALLEVIRGPGDLGKFSYAVDLPHGYTMETNTSGGVDLVGESGQRQHFLPAPWAFDANGAAVPVAYGVSGRSLTMTVDHHGLDVAYPVVADPCWSCIWETTKNTVLTVGGVAMATYGGAIAITGAITLNPAWAFAGYQMATFGVQVADAGISGFRNQGE